MKILYFDTETTGLDPVSQDIIQIAGIVVIDGVEKERFNIKLQPYSYEKISQEALDIHGYSIEQLKTFDDPLTAYNQLLTIFAKYIDKYDKNDKFTPAGYNVHFDINFLREFFKKMNDKYYGSWFFNTPLDVLAVVQFYAAIGKIKLENYKLSTVCEHFGLQLDAHDAFNDISATRELLSTIYNEFQKPIDKYKQEFILGNMLASGLLVVNEYLTPKQHFDTARQLIQEIQTNI